MAGDVFMNRAALLFFASLRVAEGTFMAVVHNQHPRAMVYLAFLAVSSAVTWTIFSILLAYAWPPIALRVENGHQWAAFDRAANRARGTELLDIRGRYVGLISSAFERDNLEFLGSEVWFGGVRLYPDHKTIPLADAPPHFWRCFVWLEDRHRDTWRNPFGIDFVSVWRIPFDFVLGSVREGRFVRPRGGSTLEMQLARSMRKRYAHNSNAVIRKLQEWRAAPVLKHQLVTRGDDRRLRAWIAQHIALVQGAGGRQDIFGVEAAGRFLFGKSASQLDAAEQLVLAAAAQRPLRMRRSPESQQRTLRLTIEDRALLCADGNRYLHGQPIIPDQDERQATVVRLVEFMTKPYPGPHVNPDFMPFVSDLTAHPAGPRLDPQRLAANLALGVQQELVAQIADEYAPTADGAAHPWRGQIAAVTLTLDLAANLAFRGQLDGAILAIEEGVPQSQPPRLSVGVLGAPSRANNVINTGSSEVQDIVNTPLVRYLGTRVPLLTIAAAGDGRIVRFVNTGANSYYFGSVGQRPDVGFFADGAYDADLERRAIASIGKVAVALVLAEAGEENVDRVLDNTCLPGLSDRCMSPRTFLGGVPRASMRKAFAESLNSAVIREAARVVDPQRIDEFMQALGFRLPEEHRGSAAATNLVLGRYVGRPRSVQMLMQVALAYAQGKFDATIYAPTFIDSVQMFEPSKDRFLGPGPTPFAVLSFKLRDLIRPGPNPPGAAAFVRRALSSPMCFEDAENIATLRRLRKWCADINPLVRIHLAKTGTFSTGQSVSSYNEADWWIAGAIEFVDGRDFSYVVTAGAGIPSAPFARNLGAGRLAPVVDALLQDLYRERPVRSPSALRAN